MFLIFQLKASLHPHVHLVPSLIKLKHSTHDALAVLADVAVVEEERAWLEPISWQTSTQGLPVSSYLKHVGPLFPKTPLSELYEFTGPGIFM